MTTETNSPDVKWEGHDLVVQGPPGAIKEKFYQLLRERVSIVDDREFKLMFPDLHIAAIKSRIVIVEGNSKKRIKGIGIYVNKDDFVFGDDDYSDLIDIVVTHEIAELWYFSKTGYSLSPAPEALAEDRLNIAHELALRDEYRVAFELGKAERLLEFMERHHREKHPSESSLEENRRTYNLVKKRWEN
ncbi:MAG: hypothetical protein ABIE03_03680 [Patescibacteria group bacterium]|nr:hypothetical protein [Patescibacteria group bacterium]